MIAAEMRVPSLAESGLTRLRRWGIVLWEAHHAFTNTKEASSYGLESDFY